MLMASALTAEILQRGSLFEGLGARELADMAAALNLARVRAHTNLMAAIPVTDPFCCKAFRRMTMGER